MERIFMKRYYIGCGIDDFNINDKSRYNFDFENQDMYLKNYVNEHNFEKWLENRPTNDQGANEWKYVLGVNKRLLEEKELSCYMIYPLMQIFYDKKIPNVILFKIIVSDTNNNCIADIIANKLQKKKSFYFEIEDDIVKKLYHKEPNRGGMVVTQLEYLNFFTNKDDINKLKTIFCAYE